MGSLSAIISGIDSERGLKCTLALRVSLLRNAVTVLQRVAAPHANGFALLPSDSR